MLTCWLPVGVELDTTLLHKDAAEMFHAVERVAGDVVFHDLDSYVQRR